MVSLDVKPHVSFGKESYATQSIWHQNTYCMGIACRLERRTGDRRVASSNPSRKGGRIFFSRINVVCWLLFAVRSTPVLSQWHARDRGHSAKSAGGRCHLNMHTLLTRQGRSGLICRCPGLVWKPIRKRAHTQLVMENSATVVSARWATVDWFWHKEWN